QPEAVDEPRLEQLTYQRQAADGPHDGVSGLQPADGTDEVVADRRVRPGNGLQGPREHRGGCGGQAGRTLILNGFRQHSQCRVGFAAPEAAVTPADLPCHAAASGWVRAV